MGEAAGDRGLGSGTASHLTGKGEPLLCWGTQAEQARWRLGGAGSPAV